MSSIVAVIPARGGSKGVPQKNLRPFLGSALFLWQARACRDSGIFTDVYISTDDAAIKAVALDAAFKVHDRSAESATDTASSEAVLLEFVEWYRGQQHQGKDGDDNNDRGNVGYVCLSQATSPLTTATDYREAWKLLRASSADSLVTVSRTHAFYWRVHENTGEATPVNYDPSARPRRQDWDGNWEENGAFYMTRVALLQESKSRLVGRVVAHVLTGEGQKYEIDSLLDFTVCEAVRKFCIGAGEDGDEDIGSFLDKEKEQAKLNENC